MKKGNCLACQSIVLSFSNAMQERLNSFFEEKALVRKATPKSTWNRFSGHCVYCNKETDWGLRGNSKNMNAPQLDHWIPISLGGPPSVWNMLLCCKSCNITKGNNLYTYPPDLIKENPRLEHATREAIKLVLDAWGELYSTGIENLSHCEVKNYLSNRWPDVSKILGVKFPKLQNYLNNSKFNDCTKISEDEMERIVSILERETERVLYG